MHSALSLTSTVLFLIAAAPCMAAESVADGAHCRIDSISFDGDLDITRIDYVIPPGGKLPRFRLLALHSGENGMTGVELKTHAELNLGSTPLSQEATWKSVVKLPKQRDSAVSSGDLSLTHFEPHGDRYASGTIQFSTSDGHRGECHFRLVMQVVDLGAGH